MGTGELTWHWMGYKCKNCCKKKVELNPRIKKKPLDPDCIEWLQTGFNINARRISHEPIRHHPRKHMRRIK